ncbi:MAG: Gfo/Idh/MocA family protein [Candidatus Dormibacteria bacterium]
MGVLGAAWIADRAVLPAMRAARNVDVVAIASRDPGRAALMAKAHGVPRVHDSYQALIEDDDVDAVYIALINSLHRTWTVTALRAGKHVLCEKPLGCTANDVRAMAAAAAETERVLMEAFMYRFHPRIVALREHVSTVRHLHAAFSFRVGNATTYRLVPALGGGALLDVGCYTLDVARWFCGEPRTVRAAMQGSPVDMSVAAVIEFASRATATVWASFEAPEHQRLLITTDSETVDLVEPFTAWRDPHDPYQLMAEAFADAAVGNVATPRSIDDSLRTAELLDRVREAASGTAAPSPS